MIEPSYHYFENEDARKIVDRALRPLLPFLPAWTQDLHVFSGGIPENNEELVVESLVEYRRVGITVYAPFFDREEGQQARQMRHELVHTTLGSLVGFVKKRLLSPIRKSNQELCDALEGELDDRVESVTEELSFLLAGLTDSEPPPLDMKAAKGDKP